MWQEEYEKLKTTAKIFLILAIVFSLVGAAAIHFYLEEKETNKILKTSLDDSVWQSNECFKRLKQCCTGE